MKRNQLFFSASYHCKLCLVVTTLMVKIIHASDVILQQNCHWQTFSWTVENSMRMVTPYRGTALLCFDIVGDRAVGLEAMRVVVRTVSGA